jgi:RNA polymerase sigma-70 factor (ECF subfamily)
MWMWAVFDRWSPVSGPPRQGPEDRRVDQDLIGRVAAGDGDALAALYDRHERAVYSLVFRIVQDQGDAEDVVQDVFSQAWAQASRHDAARGAVGAWLLTIARSRAIDRLRARRARPDNAAADDREMGALRDPLPSHDAELVSREQAVRVRSALERLPVLQRIAIELAYYEGLSQSEIAERLEQPLGTIKTRMRLALLKLREALAGVDA